MKPDIIVSWPDNCDYPLWRQFIRDNRDRFANVIIVVTKAHALDDYSEMIRWAMIIDNCAIFESPQVKSGEDWRNVAVNAGLAVSNAEWVWFTEQDFFVTPDFWGEVQKLESDSDVISVDITGRLHPCCIFVKRSIIEKTHKNFGIVPDRLDHFGVFQEDIKNSGARMMYVPQEYWHHMNGLSHNFRLMSEGGRPNYNEKEFIDYLRMCKNVTVMQDKIYNIKVDAYLAGIGAVEHSPTTPPPVKIPPVEANK